MARKDLINEIADFCFAYGLFKKSVDVNNIKAGMEKQFDDVEFIEALIHMLTTKTRIHKNIDIEKLKALLIELEKIRLELEYKE